MTDVGTGVRFLELSAEEISYCNTVESWRYSFDELASSLYRRSQSAIDQLLVAVNDPQTPAFTFTPSQRTAAKKLVDRLARRLAYQLQLCSESSSAAEDALEVLQPMASMRDESPEETFGVMLQLEAYFGLQSELMRLDAIADILGKELELGDTYCRVTTVTESLSTDIVWSSVELTPTDADGWPLGATIVIRYRRDCVEFGVAESDALGMAAIDRLSWHDVIETCARQLFDVCNVVLSEKTSTPNYTEAPYKEGPCHNIEFSSLMAFCRQTLLECFSSDVGAGDSSLANVRFPSDGLQRVNITIRCKGRLRASKDGRGATLMDALKNGMQRAVLDTRFGGPLLREEVTTARIEVFLQHSSTTLSPNAVLSDPALCEGAFGLECNALEGVYFKPTVAVTQGIRNSNSLLRRLLIKAGKTPGESDIRRLELKKTRWTHLVEGDHIEEYFVFSRNRQKCDLIFDEHRLSESLWMAAAQSLRSQLSDGLFCYRYDAGRDLVLPGSANMVRMAGCAYGLSRLASSRIAPPNSDKSGLSPQQVVSGADKCVQMLLGKCRTLANGLGVYVLERNRGKGLLGCAALLTLALQESRLREQYTGVRQRIVSGMLSLQQSDGSFACTVHDPSDRRSEDYFPGEALFAIAREAAITDGSRLLDVLESAFPYYSHYFGASKVSAFVPWHIDAWKAAFEVTRNNNYAQFVFEMADWICQHQLTIETSRDEDFAGGFDFSGESPHRMPNVSSTVFIEALFRAAQLASLTGDASRQKMYKSAAESGIRFILRLQLNPVDVLVLPNPRLAVGGVTRDLASYEIRCDNNQHFITCVLAAIETNFIES
jgi:hypothetical protein